MISDLRLQHFRSYLDESFELAPGVNIIVGPNASGKTNLLEAILVLALGNSYRAKDAELIRFDRPWARLDADLTDGHKRTVKIVAGPQAQKTYEIAGKEYRRLSLNTSLPVVLFEPDNLQLLTGSPERRRDYLDDLLEQSMPGYGSLRRQFRRALAQRNALLKQHNVDQTRIFPWSLRLSQLAGQIVRARTELTRELDKQIGRLYKELSRARTTVRLEYQSRWPAESYETRLLSELEHSLELDRQRGFTGVGPHREDLTIFFNGRPAQDTVSRGETRSMVLALKILELRRLEAARDRQPLLLLDDVFSELDGRRRHALTDYLAPYQTFITTTDADLVLQHFTETCQVIPLG